MACTRRRRAQYFGVLLSAFLFAALRNSPGQAAAPPTCLRTNQSSTGLSAIEAQIKVLRDVSFLDLENIDLRVHNFHSQADYFRTRFSVPRFLFLKPMRYFIEVNPELFSQQAPSDGVCAVLVHELSHVVSLNHGNRIRRFSLIRLLSTRYTARFERRTDLEAIRRGYGDGLKSYRTWVYTHIPTSALPIKRRNYFSPEEVEAIEQHLRENPELFTYWSKHTPRNLQEILKSPR